VSEWKIRKIFLLHEQEVKISSITCKEIPSIMPASQNGINAMYATSSPAP
jgi:hypothetical protein